VDDPRWAASEPGLVELLRDAIVRDGPMTFARFMDRALTEPGLGYYATTHGRPTREGDFLTAPELHPFFGRCVGRHLSELWRRLDPSATFRVREYGAGAGTLERTARAGVALDDPELAQALRWEGVDLPWGRPPGDPGARPDVVLANEFLDALPVHRLRVVEGRLRERYVDWRDGWFTEILGPPSDEALGRHLDEEGVVLAEGQSADVSPGWAAFMRRAAAELAARGAVVVIDYGHDAAALYAPRRGAGTLMTYRDHRAGDDPFAAVGRQDLTAHVDFTAVDRAARGSGLELLGSTRQGAFLAGLGLGDLLFELGHDPTTGMESYIAARAAVARLIDPRHLGGLRVVAYGRGIAADPPLRGFSVDVPARR
jgi:SAM-dependent MidA family methyltransferase